MRNWQIIIDKKNRTGAIIEFQEPLPGIPMGVSLENGATISDEKKVLLENLTDEYAAMPKHNSNEARALYRRIDDLANGRR